MKRFAAVAVIIAILPACPSEFDPEIADAGERDAVDFVREDTGPPPSFTGVVIEDLTEPGEGLPLDAVELCNVLGEDCIALDDVVDSSGATTDYAGAINGVNADGEGCAADGFTLMTSGDSVTLGAAEAAFASTSKINVYIASDACDLIPVAAKPFRVALIDDGGTLVELETCEGTCTVQVP